MKNFKSGLTVSVIVFGLVLWVAPVYAGPKISGGKMSIGSAGSIRHNAATPAFNRSSGFVARPSTQFGNAAGRPAPAVLRTRSGQTFIPPRNSIGPFPTRSRNGNLNGGISFIGGTGHASKMRIMPPRRPTKNAPGAPKGYVKYTNGSGQAVNPSTGKTVSKKDAHISIK